MSFVGTFFRNSFQKIYTRLTTYQDFNMVIDFQKWGSIFFPVLKNKINCGQYTFVTHQLSLSIWIGNTIANLTLDRLAQITQSFAHSRRSLFQSSFFLNRQSPKIEN